MRDCVERKVPRRHSRESGGWLLRSDILREGEFILPAEVPGIALELKIAGIEFFRQVWRVVSGTGDCLKMRIL